ncbi:succinylglutamate desuccinylase/aspartoacylase family protein [Haladaptatus cibarius]|uniref:succinylglutamate desuccinylase/aspartoacylase family protein n=1 Tax=Haladaptatus cibarius TaxID=453847 RepID=UPI00067879C0|nr:succinylglutamate desuccinylase/aspartoacylase family protein [Haladaptatus cibarius]
MKKSRRAFLSALGTASVGGTVALAGCAGDGPQDAKADSTGTVGTTQEGAETTAQSDSKPEQTVTTSTIRAGTEQETTLYEIQSEKSGPTAFVIGGMHGNEESGYWAASDIREWEIDAGTLVVLPEANTQAIEQERRKLPEGVDLNRQFPIGEPPKNTLAQGIWDAISQHDPDVLMDLHSSKGILERENDEGVGQNIFRSSHEKIIQSNQTAIELLNEEYVTGYDPIYDFVHTLMDKTEYATAPVLMNKTRIDLDIPSCLFEVTQDDVEPEKRARWTKVFVSSMLDTWGVRAFQMDDEAGF